MSLKYEPPSEPLEPLDNLWQVMEKWSLFKGLQETFNQPLFLNPNPKT